MYISLVTWERHEILQKSLNSLAKCNFPPDTHIIITDDKSVDPKVVQSIRAFKEKVKDKVDVEIRVRDKRLTNDANNVENMQYCSTRSKEGESHVICLESDGIYNKDFLFKFIELREEVKEKMKGAKEIGMLSLFHYEKIKTTNENFTPTLKVKEAVGAFCTMFHRAIIKDFKVQKGFDWSAAKLCQTKGFLVLCSKPSYAQHISTGHPQSMNTPKHTNTFAKDFIGEG